MNTVQDYDLKKFASLLSDIKVAMLSTVNEDGSIYCRPMVTLKIDENNFDGKIYFFTRKDSLKVQSLQKDAHMNLAYSDPKKQTYISICATGNVTYDKAKMKELYTPLLKAWFPEGLEDPQIALIEVNIINAEIWETPSSKMVQLAGLLKAQVTGKPFSVKGLNHHIDLKSA